MKKSIKSILQGPIGSALLALLYRVVYLTSKISYLVPGGQKFGETNPPSIYTSWHGHSYLLPFLFKKGCQPTLMVARHGDGRMAGGAMNKLGMKLVFGSGSTGKTNSKRGGAAAFLGLLRILRQGNSIKITADVPKISRVVGEGVILLARKSGSPIVPLAVASSRRRHANSWDRMQINLPFSHVVFVQGEKIFVPNDGSDLASYQKRLHEILEDINRQAIDLADAPKT